MAKRKKSRIQRRIEETGIDPANKDRIQINYSFPDDPLQDLDDAEEELSSEFVRLYGDVVKAWGLMSKLHAVLIELRGGLADQTKLRVALDLLGAKGFADARGGFVLLKSGYQMASLGPLRAGFEAGDLMDHFTRVPDDAALWLDEDKKFDNLGWIRKQLPIDSGPSYDFLNWGLHANWRMIPQLMRRGGNPLDTTFQIVPGPVRNETLTEFLAGMSITVGLRVVALLHDHSPSLVSDIWRDQYQACIAHCNTVLEKTQARAKESLSLLEAFGRENAVDVTPR